MPSLVLRCPHHLHLLMSLLQKLTWMITLPLQPQTTWRLRRRIPFLHLPIRKWRLIPYLLSYPRAIISRLRIYWMLPQCPPACLKKQRLRVLAWSSHQLLTQCQLRSLMLMSYLIPLNLRNQSQYLNHLLKLSWSPL